MNRHQRFWSRLFVAVIVAGCASLGDERGAPAATTAGTAITNQSTASYSDGTNTYAASSNVVSVTVQNVPTMTVTQVGSNQNTAPGQIITDTFQIANTGNYSGTVVLSAAVATGGTASGSISGYTYLLNGTPESTFAALQTAMQSVTLAQSGTMNVGVVYTLLSTATPGNDVQMNITGTMDYLAAGTAPAVNSSATSATTYEDDTVKADARLDLQLTSSTPTLAANPFVYTLTAAEGASSTWGARDLTAVQTLVGGSAPTGVFMSVLIPQYPAGTPLTVNNTTPAAVTTSTANGYPANGGVTSTIYYSTSSTGAGSWTALATGGSVPSTAYYIGVLISGGQCTINGATQMNVEFCPQTTPNATQGTVTSPAVTLTFSVNQSTANGSGNSGSISTVANSLIGGNAATKWIIGPGIAANSLADGTSDTSTITASTKGVDNVLAALLAPPSGASNVTLNASVQTVTVENGPAGNASATGAYDTNTTQNDSNDFTAVSFTGTGGSAAYATSVSTPTWTPVTTAYTGTVSGISVESTIANTGNTLDNYTIIATAPSGWTVTLYQDSTVTPNTKTSTVLNGSSSTAAASQTATNVSVASGATLNYWAVYNTPSGGVLYLSHGVGTVQAKSTVNAGISNFTNHLLYAGFVAITTSATPTGATGCTATATSICPGGTITYAIDYRNIVAQTDLSNYAVSFAGVTAKSLAITDDGTSGSSNWATYTNGITTAPTDSMTPASTFTYYTGTSSPTSIGTTFVSPVTKFVEIIGGAGFSLVPYGYASGTGSQGVTTFSVIVK